MKSYNSIAQTRNFIATKWFLHQCVVHYLTTKKKSFAQIDGGTAPSHHLAENPPIVLNGLHSFDGYQKK